MSTINKEEIAQFSHLAHDWWNENGHFKILHKLNPIRLEFIRNEIINHFANHKDGRALFNMTVLDVGCGGGVLSEPLARMGGKVTGIDASNSSIQIAKIHAQQSDLNIHYLNTTIEEIAKSEKKFDIVCALEIVEHVDNLELFLASCCSLLKPNGLLFISTINRTLKSFVLGIVAAEYILQWVPKGTHKWQKFLKPYDILQELEKYQYDFKMIKGMQFYPLQNIWSLSSEIDVNYIASAAFAKKY